MKILGLSSIQCSSDDSPVKRKFLYMIQGFSTVKKKKFLLYPFNSRLKFVRILRQGSSHASLNDGSDLLGFNLGLGVNLSSSTLNLEVDWVRSLKF